MEERGQTDLADINKRLIQQCTNTLTRDREFSGPEIMAYLMGWGDRFESHHYVGISLDALIGAVKERFPGLKTPQGGCSFPALTGSDDPRGDCGNKDRPHTITMVSGKFTLKDSLHEYMYHG